jgi:DNA processing protein
MDERGLLDLIIARIPGLSVRERISLCENFDGEDDFIRMGTVSGVESVIARKLECTRDINQICVQAERDARTARARDIRWVAWNSAAYPPLLREIYDPPVLLFYGGACLTRKNRLPR